MATWFAFGYTKCWNASDPNDNFLTLAIGTNNSGVVNSTTGADWANVGAALASQDSGYGYSSYVTAWAANDIEGGPGFATYATTESWQSGYQGVPAGELLFDYGSANCSTVSKTCGDGWTEYDYWVEAWGAGPNYPFVEIYSDTLAEEWAQIASQNGGIDFGLGGILSQALACQQTGEPSGCSGLNISPSTAYTDFVSATGQSPEYVDNIGYSELSS